MHHVQIVFNPSTYPNFLRFLSLYPKLKSLIQPTEMTFGVSRDGGKFEWAGNSLRSVFCQTARILDKNMWRMLYDIFRFNACAREVIKTSGKHQRFSANMTIGEYLEQERYSAAFRDNYLIVRLRSCKNSIPTDTPL
jgi:predicted NAD/FAD-binding protein